jgi:phosphoribosyl-AMP cyclohydrolase
MNKIEAWQQGHSDGLTLAVQQINEWCKMDCKTLADVIREINKLREQVTS